MWTENWGSLRCWAQGFGSKRFQPKPLLISNLPMQKLAIDWEGPAGQVAHGARDSCNSGSNELSTKLHKFLVNMCSQNPNFQTDYLKLPESCKKSEEKGLDWCYIGA